MSNSVYSPDNWQERLEDVYFHSQLSWAVIYLSPLVAFILLVFKPSTYGKLHHPGRNLFGPLVSAKWCWIIFESPNWIWVLYAYRYAIPEYTRLNYVQRILLAWFFMHYIHRSILYPLSMSTKSKFPIGIMAATIPYCIVNGYLQAYQICRFYPSNTYNRDEDYSPFSLQFTTGLFICIFGFVLGHSSDTTLINLRRTGTYHIPTGSGFTFVSCPHYLGEILEWFGFAMASQFSLCSMSFVLWTCANLIPRGLQAHEWYHRKFPEDYPKERYAVIPFIL